MLLSPPVLFSSRGLIIHFSNTREFVCDAVGSQKTLPPAPLNLSKHLPHPPWKILWRVGLKSRALCIIHECWWISISDTTLNGCWEHLCPHSVLHGEMWQHMVTVETLHVHNCAPAWNQTISPTVTTFTVAYLQYNTDRACPCAARMQECSLKVPSVFTVLTPSSSHSCCSFPSLTPSLRHHRTAR